MKIHFTNYKGFGIDKIESKRFSLTMHSQSEGYVLIIKKQIRIGFITVFYTSSAVA